jgi:hypothetical protein
MSVKRVKLSFNKANEGKYTVIRSCDIAKTNKRVRSEMKEVIRVYDNKETKSQQSAALLVLNS